MRPRRAATPRTSLGAPRASTESGGSAARAGAVGTSSVHDSLTSCAEQAGGWGLTLTETGEAWIEAEWDEWGNLTSLKLDGAEAEASEWPIPQGFAGGLFDPTTGLTRFGARDYDPALGRWTAKDPILFQGGQGNLYVYVANDPVQFVDPEGRESFASLAGGAIAAAARGAWTSIQLTAGLLVGLSGSGLNAGVVGGNLEFYGNGWLQMVGTLGLTLGNVIIYKGQNPSPGLRTHEQQHIPQSDALGPLYLPLHIANQAIGEGILGMPHSATPLECGPSDASNPRPWP